MKPKVSVIIPTKNGEEYLEECLNMVFKQKTSFDFEVLIIDSGSTDSTLEIIDKFKNQFYVNNKNAPSSDARSDSTPSGAEGVGGGVDGLIPPLRPSDTSPQLRGGGLCGLKFFQIPPLEFNHGLTRNLGASKARGEYFVFITQDAIPADENWLKNIIEPFEKDPEIAGVFGKHLPRRDCDPFQRKSLNEFMDSFGEDLATFQLSGNGDKEKEFEDKKNHLAFFSNVNSAARRSVFEKIPFKKVDMGEDQFWAKDILLAGYKKAYAPKAAVYHSHNYGIWNQFKRWFDEYRQHKINIKYIGVSSAFKIPLLTLRLWANDVRYIRCQKEYNFWQKIYWTLWIFFMDLARFCAEYLGGHYEKLPLWIQNRMSMQWEIIHKR